MMMCAWRWASTAMMLALISSESCHQAPTAPRDTRTIRTIRLGAVGDFGMNVAQRRQLVVTLRDSMSNLITNRAVAFESSDTTVAVVSSSGIVTALRTGTTTLTVRADSLSATRILHVSPPTPQFAQIEVGGSTTCALTAAGDPYCWLNRLGDGSSNGTPQPVPAPVAFQSIAVGTAYQCALDASGRAYCWGDNSTFQLGTGDSIARTTPTPIAAGLQFTSISAGWRSTCAIAADSTAYCWGFNASGELGNGSTTSSAVPVPVAGGLHFVSVSAGNGFACGLTSDGAVCWGDNHVGELGRGDTLTTSTPVKVSGGLTFVSISADAAHACGLIASGTAYCWGANVSGDLGLGSANGFVHPTPEPVVGGLTWRAVSVGGMTCGIATTGLSYCWGSNLYSLLADGSWTASSAVPALVWGGLAFRTIKAHGADHACALGFDNLVYCWGGYVS